MNVLLYSILLLAIASLLHLVLWRIRLPRKQTNTLFVIFLLVLASGTFVLFRFPGLISWNILPDRNIFEVAQFFLLYISAAVAYIISYPAIEVDSPTLIIIKAVSDAGRQGLDKDKLKTLVNDRLLIMPRIRDMVSDNMAYITDGKYRLTPKGFIMARIFALYRSFVRLGKGG